MKYAAVTKTLGAALLLAASSLAQTPQTAAQPVRLVVDAGAATTPFPHFWERTFGSGRAILALRDSYRTDLRAVKQATDFESVRFHGILNDEVGPYDPDRRPVAFAQMTESTAAASADAGVFNFSYVDQIYDGLLDNHVKPFVELSFMPKKLSSDPNAIHPFWYHPNVAPPKDYAVWDAMITALGRHLIARYGADEVATWKFEVWNEPNLDFWGGTPKQATYWELYDHTARALKAVSPRLQVGGPATAQAAWVTPFLQHIQQSGAPVDFVSTHVYANDTAKDVFGTSENIPRDQMVARAVRKVHDEIAHSAYPRLPLIFSEYNASYANEPNVTDSPYMGPWLANTIRLCDGLIDNMAYWSFSDVFEEQGVVRTPFYGGFGLVAADDIPKASFNVFAILHKLGTRRIPLDSDSALATTDAAGNLTLALWNYAPPSGTGAGYTMPPAVAAPERTFELYLKHVSSRAQVSLWRVDPTHSNVVATFDAMGRPQGSLSREDIARLRAAGALAPVEHRTLSGGKLRVTVPAHGLLVLTVNK